MKWRIVFFITKEGQIVIKREADNNSVKCNVCEFKGYLSDRCWTVVGYFKWYLKYK